MNCKFYGLKLIIVGLWKMKLFFLICYKNVAQEIVCGSKETEPFLLFYEHTLYY